jgi:PAS domain S-box-containing protein
MAQCLRNGAAQSEVEVVVEQPNGKRRSVIVSPKPVFNEAGDLIGGLNTISDITAVKQAEERRSRSEVFSRQVLQNSQDCIKLLDLEGRLQSINPCGVSALEIDDPEEAIGQSYFDFWEGSDREAALAAARDAIKDGQGRFTASFTSSKGRLTRWDEIVSPRLNELGETCGFLVISRDITSQEKTTRELENRLQQQKAIAELSAVALSERSLDRTLTFVVEKVSEVLRCPLVKVLRLTPEADSLLLSNGVGWKEGLVGTATVDVDRGSQAGYTLASKETVVVNDLWSEERFNGPDLLLSHGVRSGMSATIAGLDSRPYGVLGVHSTELRDFGPSEVEFVSSVANILASRFRLAESEQRRQLVLREMAHRTGNLMQMVSSIFEQTVRFTSDLEEAKRSFGNRLSALARVNYRVVSDGWNSTRLVELVNETLSPFEGRFLTQGRDIVLPSDLCFDLGLVLHELATNSAKYGAFSSANGKVSLNWAVERQEGQGRLVLDWSDTGSNVRQSSARVGFGSQLVASLVQIKWGGKLTIENEGHYRCRMVVPVPQQSRMQAVLSKPLDVAAE